MNFMKTADDIYKYVPHVKSEDNIEFSPIVKNWKIHMYSIIV